MCVSHMTDAAKDLVLNKLKTTFWTSDKYQKEIDSLIRFIKSGPGSDGQEFLTKMRITDGYRKQSFIDTHCEIAEAMGYVQ